MTNAEFLIKQVNDKGWLAIANLYFDNGLTMFPFTARGRVCLSPSAEMIFSTSRLDSTNSYVLGRDYVAMDDRYGGLFQTITCVSFDMLQHIDMNLFAFDRINPDGAETFLTPKFYKPSEIEALEAGEDGLYASCDTLGFHTGTVSSAKDLYPDLSDSLDDYHGILVDRYKKFIKNQKAFVEAMNKMYGLTDCI